MSLKEQIEKEKKEAEKIKKKKKLSKEEQDFFGIKDELNRRNFVIYDSQFEKLRETAFEKDLSMSEVLREALDSYFKK